MERALRLSESTSQRARRTRAWVREALGGLEYPVFRGWDEARCARDYGTRTTSPPPETADKPYRFTLPGALPHDHHHDAFVAAPGPDDDAEPGPSRWAGMLALSGTIRTLRRGAMVGHSTRRPCWCGDRLLARRRWPSPGDSAQVWQRHQQRRANAYTHAAAQDHYHEATYSAHVEQATADFYAEHAAQTQAGRAHHDRP